MRNTFKYFTILIIPFLFSCDKDTWVKEELIGTWISKDATDTLEFIDYFIFTKNSYNGWQHFYNYDIEADSIEIEYNGPNDILILPSTHHFEINGNSLSLDFSNYCYGFERKNYEFIKEK
jgi:hypothetical protein